MTTDTPNGFSTQGCILTSILLSAEHRCSQLLALIYLLVDCFPSYPALRAQVRNGRSLRRASSLDDMSDAKELLYKVEYERYLHHRIESKLARSAKTLRPLQSAHTAVPTHPHR